MDLDRILGGAYGKADAKEPKKLGRTQMKKLGRTKMEAPKEESMEEPMGGRKRNPRC
jgi:hypothetical protein